jgi:malonate transporter
VRGTGPVIPALLHGSLRRRLPAEPTWGATIYAILNVAFPVFALILIGYLCRRHGILSVNASAELSRFVVVLGLPALLFDATSRLRPADFTNLGFIAAFAIGTLSVFGLTIVLRVRQRSRLDDATIEGLGASYANTGFIGIPLCLLAFGQEAMAPAVIATVMTACLLFALAIVMVEISAQSDRRIGPALLKVTTSLVRNPLIVAPFLGLMLGTAELSLPKGLQQLLTLLGGAAGPCALVSLGLFLARPVETDAPVDNQSTMLILLKLFAQPAITAVLAYWVFRLPRVWADAAVLLSALPAGTGPYMLAEIYSRNAVVISRVILISTVGSLVTVSLILAAMSRY